MWFYLIMYAITMITKIKAFLCFELNMILKNIFKKNQESPEWDLSEETIIDLKEIFMMFDTDVDGILTIDQVYC